MVLILCTYISGTDLFHCSTTDCGLVLLFSGRALLKEQQVLGWRPKQVGRVRAERIGLKRSGASARGKSHPVAIPAPLNASNLETRPGSLAGFMSSRAYICFLQVPFPFS